MTIKIRIKRIKNKIKIFLFLFGVNKFEIQNALKRK
jgi:hypothetical protein